MRVSDQSHSLAKECAKLVFRGFEGYNADFRRLTRRARERFEHRQWTDAQKDAVERIELYERSLQQLLTTLGEKTPTTKHDRALWAQIKHQYSRIIEHYPDIEFTKTYFSSLTRRIFKTVGVAPEIEYVALDIEPVRIGSRRPNCRIYRNRGSLDQLFPQVLSDFEFGVPYRSLSRCSKIISERVMDKCAPVGGANSIWSIDFLKPVFYQNTRAYLVGKLIGDRYAMPLVIALRSTQSGIDVDAVIMSEDEVSILFGFTRSYFHVDLHPVDPAVVFIKTIIPLKSSSEIYTVLGRARQGKTERFRDLYRHLGATGDRFVNGAYDKGMVMIVFTLPSYGVVFKVIRDRFPLVKTVQRQDVMDKYQLVFKHDRAGRLVDAQEFRYLKFNKARFSEPLLEELLTEASESVALDGDDVVIKHLYIERRLTPLSRLLKEADRDVARNAMLDYGQALRDLAASNIFPGDLLLKNFGVSRHARVIFYDYDELCLLTDCRFREMPEPEGMEEEAHSGAWFYVAENDVFPEQFISFLGFDQELADEFLEVHGEILTAEFWRQHQRRIKREEVIDVIPYRQTSIVS